MKEQRHPKIAGYRLLNAEPRRAIGHPVDTERRQATAQPAGQSRRAFLKSAAIYGAGLASGALAGYGTAYFTALSPPEELADSQASEPPIRAIVLPERNQPLQGELWTYPGVLSQNQDALAAISGKLTNFDDFHDRLYATGFLDTGLTLAKLVVEGRRNAPIRIVDIRARIVARRPIGSTYSVIGPGAEGGTDDTVGLGFDLADQFPVARKIESSLPITLGAPFFADSSTELARGEQEVYSIRALAAPEVDLEWELVLEVVAAGASNSDTTVAVSR